MYERFQLLCKLKGVTVRQVAKDTGLLESSLSNWKKRKGGINSDTLMSLCKYFKVSADWMLGLNEDELVNIPNGYEISSFEYEVILALRKADAIDHGSVIRTLHLEEKEKEADLVS